MDSRQSALYLRSDSRCRPNYTPTSEAHRPDRRSGPMPRGVVGTRQVLPNSSSSSPVLGCRSREPSNATTCMGGSAGRRSSGTTRPVWSSLATAYKGKIPNARGSATTLVVTPSMLPVDSSRGPGSPSSRKKRSKSARYSPAASLTNTGNKSRALRCTGEAIGSLYERMYRRREDEKRHKRSDHLAAFRVPGVGSGCFGPQLLFRRCQQQSQIEGAASDTFANFRAGGYRNCELRVSPPAPHHCQNRRKQIRTYRFVCDYVDDTSGAYGRFRHGNISLINCRKHIATMRQQDLPGRGQSYSVAPALVGNHRCTEFALQGCDCL